MMKKFALIPLALASAMLLSACDGNSNKKGHNALARGAVKEEAFCAKADLPAAKRHSFILIDAALLQPAETPDELQQKNQFARELLLTLAGPGRALSSGFAAPRERFSILVTGSDGSAAKLIFTGCVPGMTADEQKALVDGTSQLDEFVSGDPTKAIAAAGDEFTASMLLALFAAVKEASGGVAKSGGPFAKSPYLQSLAASRQLLEAESGVARRIVLASDFSRFRFEDSLIEASAKAQGIAAGRAAEEMLRFFESYVVQPKGAAIKGKDYLAGFMLAQGARFAYLGSDMPSVATRAPVAVAEFAGQVKYASGPESVQIRLGRDDRGNLVYSFFALLGSNASVTPMSGTMLCNANEACKILSDESGFAQSWKTSPGAAPQFDAEMPLAGARSFKLAIDAGNLSGEISDEQLQLSADPARPGLAVTATQK